MHFDASMYTTLEEREQARRAAAEIVEETVAATDDVVMELSSVRTIKRGTRYARYATTLRGGL